MAIKISNTGGRLLWYIVEDLAATITAVRFGILGFDFTRVRVDEGPRPPAQRSAPSSHCTTDFPKTGEAHVICVKGHATCH